MLRIDLVFEFWYALQGNSITCDNFFTCYDLGQMFPKRNLKMISTIRKEWKKKDAVLRLWL